MKIFKIEDLEGDENQQFVLKTVFSEDISRKGTLTMGTVSIPPGVRVPAEGEGVHEGDEYSILYKGSIKIVSGGREHRLSAGQACFIPAGEAHSSFNDGNVECELVWVMVNP